MQSGAFDAPGLPHWQTRRIIGDQPAIRQARFACSPFTRTSPAPYRRPFGNDALKLIQQGAEKIREEKFHGRDTEVFRLTDRRGRRTVWVTKDALNIPLRIELYARTSATTQVTDYTDWLTGLVLPDRYFAPDPVVLIESYEFEQYAAVLAKKGTVGPVPVLYDDLLRGPRDLDADLSR